MEPELSTIPTTAALGMTLIFTYLALTFWRHVDGGHDCGEPQAEAEAAIRRQVSLILQYAGVTFLVPFLAFPAIVMSGIFIYVVHGALIHKQGINALDRLPPNDPKAEFLRSSPLDRWAVQASYATLVLGILIWLASALSQ